MSVITMLPTQESGNAYTTLLYQALDSIGVRYRQIPFSIGYLLRHRPLERFHYLHFHWPEIFFHIRPSEPQRLFGLKGYALLEAFWHLAKRRGYKLVWTVHEVDVHDVERHIWLHARSRRTLWRLADVVFAHSEGVMREAARRWGTKEHAHVVPHGSYAGAYPADLGRGRARERLGIPARAFTFILFGNLRPYKGVDVLLEAFRKLQRLHPDARLIVAGRPYSDAYAAEIRTLAADTAGVHLHLERIPDDDVQIYLRAADCFVAPYRTIETCGVIYLALAFELPIIIKSEGNVRDFEASAMGLFLKESSVDATAAAMRRMLEMPPDERERLRATCHTIAQRYSWDIVKERYRAAFARLEGRAPRAPALGRDIAT